MNSTLVPCEQIIILLNVWTSSPAALSFVLPTVAQLSNRAIKRYLVQKHKLNKSSGK